MYKLMIVDDEPQILEGMKRILDWKQYGFGRIETCESTEEAMSKVVDLAGCRHIRCLHWQGAWIRSDPQAERISNSYEIYHYERL